IEGHAIEVDHTGPAEYATDRLRALLDAWLLRVGETDTYLLADASYLIYRQFSSVAAVEDYLTLQIRRVAEERRGADYKRAYAAAKKELAKPKGPKMQAVWREKMDAAEREVNRHQNRLAGL